MEGYNFNQDNINFYSVDNSDYPDEIVIIIVHDDLYDENRKKIVNGTYIFLDIFLGELTFAITIDNLQIIGKGDATMELIPIEKLKGFLIWRQKEFVEKYDGCCHNTDSNNYVIFKSVLNDGKPIVALINTDLLNWDRKASHPWVINFYQI